MAINDKSVSSRMKMWDLMSYYSNTITYYNSLSKFVDVDLEAVRGVKQVGLEHVKRSINLDYNNFVNYISPFLNDTNEISNASADRVNITKYVLSLVCRRWLLNRNVILTRKMIELFGTRDKSVREFKEVELNNKRCLSIYNVETKTFDLFKLYEINVPESVTIGNEFNNNTLTDLYNGVDSNAKTINSDVKKFYIVYSVKSVLERIKTFPDRLAFFMWLTKSVKKTKTINGNRIMLVSNDSNNLTSCWTLIKGDEQ